MTESKIEWTDATWNPVAGCSIISAGCTNCYAMQMARRLEAMGAEKYTGLTRKSGQRTAWNGKVREDQAALKAPYSWRKPRKIFVNSMSDLFHEQVSDAFILAVWQVMHDTPRHTYQILTKRPERMAGFLARYVQPPVWRVVGRSESEYYTALDILPNVWLGVSVEHAATVSRLNALRDTPAAVRFVSFEPLIGRVGTPNLTGIDWAIVGGESGLHARPMRPEWVGEIQRQCRLAGTAFFFKQWGAWGADGKKRSKKINGRNWRSQEWNEVPASAHA